MDNLKKNTLIYLRCCWMALSCDWFAYVTRDCTSGNGFQILGYGFKLLGKYFIYFVVRLLFALCFFITGVIIMKALKDGTARGSHYNWYNKYKESK